MDVIAAIATGSAATAIGIVRVSGDGCFALCGRVFRAAGGRPFAAQEPRKMVFGEMLDRAGRVIDRARDILSELEAEGCPAPAPAALAADSGQVSFLDMGASEVADRLRQVDIDTLTPIEAMNLLYELKKKL